MNDINISALINLATAGKEDEFTKLLGANDVMNIKEISEIAEHLTQLQEQKRQARTRDAAVEIQKLLEKTVTHIAQVVDQLRQTRRTEAQLKSHLAEINRARSYGLNTMNFLPLSKLVVGESGLYKHAIDRELTSVPDNWTAPSDTKSDEGDKKDASAS